MQYTKSNFAEAFLWSRWHTDTLGNRISNPRCNIPLLEGKESYRVWMVGQATCPRPRLQLHENLETGNRDMSTPNRNVLFLAK